MKRAYLIKLGGDPEIARALERGVTDAMRNSLPTSTGSEAVMRVDLHRGRGPEYWDTLITEARYLYDTPQPPRAVRWLLGCYGLICYGVSRLYRLQDKILMGGNN